jgi:hypothetical protein
MRLSTSLRLNAQKGLVTPYDPALTLDLQFAARQAYVANIGPLPTFTNASTTRTFVGSNGLIQTAATNVPRIDFDPVTRQCLGLLIEEQRSNLSTWSEDLTQASWSKTNTTATSNQTVAPDGNTTADLIAETTANTQHYLSGSGTNSVTSGTTYTTSVFLKKGTGSTAPDWIIIAFLASGFGSKGAAFNVSTGAVGTTVGSPTVSVKQYPNGWWRVSLSAAATASVSTTGIYIAFSNNSNTFSTPTYVGQTTSDIFIWGAQFEAGAFASSYIPTVGTAPVVRSTDVCSITGAAFTGFWNATEGTIALKTQKAYAAPATISQLNYLSINDGTANNYIQFAQRGQSPTGEVFRVENGGTSQALIQSSTSVIAANTPLGLAGVYKSNDARASCNGAAVVSDPAIVVPTLTQLQFVLVTSALWVSSLQYYNVAKTNAQLQALSTP